jgi:hypothetical protein bacD2_22994
MRFYFVFFDFFYKIAIINNNKHIYKPKINFMKKFLFLFLVMVCNFTINGQEKLTDTISVKKVFCEIVGRGNFTGTKVDISIDFGQKISFFKQYNQKLMVDEEGKKIKFNSMIDALNYMGKFGWDFEQAYAVSMGNTNVYHFLLSKDITSDKEFLDGIKTKAMIKDIE